MLSLRIPVSHGRGALNLELISRSHLRQRQIKTISQLMLTNFELYRVIDTRSKHSVLHHMVSFRNFGLPVYPRKLIRLAFPILMRAMSDWNHSDQTKVRLNFLRSE